MARILLKDTPPAVCDNCGRWSCTLDQAGIPCYFCHGGTFAHRSKWVFWDCPACHGRDADCTSCHGKGIVATPQEEAG